MNLRVGITTVAVFGLVAGCANLPSASSTPGDVAVLVSSPAPSCPSSAGTITVLLKLVNRGKGTLRVYIGNKPERPYELSWLSYDVIDESLSGDRVDWRKGPGGHGQIPQNELNVGPDDFTIVAANIYSVDQEHSAGSYRIRIRDLARQEYFSDAFHICPPRSNP